MSAADDELARIFPRRSGRRPRPALRRGRRSRRSHPRRPPTCSPSIPLLRGAAELAAELGARQTFEFLLGRHLDANPRQYTLTPGELAELMADLAGPAPRRARPRLRHRRPPARRPPAPARSCTRQEAPPNSPPSPRSASRCTPGHGPRRPATRLRADAPQLEAEAVLCHPPFNERNWGHDELAYDPRWEYGFPARNESELAWVQHALARLEDGGTAVLLMPPAAASRRSGAVSAQTCCAGAPCVP